MTATILNGVKFRFRAASGHYKRMADEYLATHKVKGLQIGCGPNRPKGWLNADLFVRADDIMRMDATRPFPLPSNAFDYVYSEHVIEHLDIPGQKNMLSEALRVLKPGGRIRISTPDLNFLIDLYKGESLSDAQIAYLDRAKRHFKPTSDATTAIYLFNNFVRDWGHTFIHDRRSLTELMELAGFRSLQWFPVLVSDDPHLRNLECMDRLPNGLLQVETMTVEATK